MDMDDELKNMKWLLIFGIGLIVSLFVTWGEAMYFFGGDVTEGQVTQSSVEERRGRRGRRYEQLVIEYRFTDAEGNQRAGADEFDADNSDVPRSGPIKISYRPGADGASRVAGHANWFGLIIAAVCFGVVAFFAGKLVLEARTYAAEEKARGSQAGKRYRF